MAVIRTSEKKRFSESGPVPKPVKVGDGLATMLLCLQKGQKIEAPDGDDAETVFTVLEGDGFITDGDERASVASGDVVHILPGMKKILEAGAGTFMVLGVRRLGGRRHAT